MRDSNPNRYLFMDSQGQMAEIIEEEDNSSLIQTLKSSSNPNSQSVVNRSPSFLHDKESNALRNPENLRGYGSTNLTHAPVILYPEGTRFNTGTSSQQGINTDPNSKHLRTK